jgi:hypothetical protein
MTYDRGPASLAKLAVLLRDQSGWPEGFVWNDRHPHHNAVGLAFKTWGGPHSYDDSNYDYVIQLSLLLKCQIAVCETLLFTHWPTRNGYKRGMFRKVTPEMVADAIEAHLGAGAQPSYGEPVPGQLPELRSSPSTVNSDPVMTS